MVSKASELFPDPETPTNATSFPLGMLTLTCLRLFSQASTTWMSFITSWDIDDSLLCKGFCNQADELVTQLDEEG
jgi:hypothetical protein